MSVQNYDTLNIENVTINIKDLQKSTHMHHIPIRYNHNMLSIQTPKMFAPFGASSYKKNEILAAGGYPKYDVCLSLNQSDERIAYLSKFLSDLDAKICNFLAQNSTILDLLNVKKTIKKTGKPKTIDQIQEDIENNKYTPIVREGSQKPDSPNEYFPSLLKAKMFRDSKTNRILSACEYNHDLVQLTDENMEEYFTKGCYCRCVIRCPYIWIINGRCGLKTELMRCKIYPKQQLTYNFLKASDDELEVDNAVNNNNNAQHKNNNNHNINATNNNDENHMNNNDNNNDYSNDMDDNKKMKEIQRQQTELFMKQHQKEYDDNNDIYMDFGNDEYENIH